MGPLPQHMQALKDANEIRLAMAARRREIKTLDGPDARRRMAIEVLDPDETAGAMRLSYALKSVPRIGEHRMIRLLDEARVSRRRRDVRVRELQGLEREQLMWALMRSATKIERRREKDSWVSVAELRQRELVAA